MARRNDHSREELQRMALDAAQFIIEAQGLAALSARKVAARMGYTVGTLYRVFQHLDDLIIQTNTRTLTELNATLRRAAAQCQDPEHCVQAVTHAYTEFATRHTRRWSALYEHGIDAHIELPDYFTAQIAGMYELLEGLLQSVAPQRSAQDIARAARALWGGVQGICILTLSNKLDIDRIEAMPEVADSLVGNFLNGLRARH
jgi:AcrR family transcriptional regulator